MKVISLVPQKTLITTGPYRFSRNPLYLGGNVFMFLGAVLVLGLPMGLVLTIVNILFVDFFIRREEKQLEREFGPQWEQYRSAFGAAVSESRVWGLGVLNAANNDPRSV